MKRIFDGNTRQNEPEKGGAFMKRRLLALALAAALLALCAACAPEQTAEKTDGFQLEGVCSGLGGLEWGESYERIFPGEKAPDPGVVEGELAGYPCQLKLSFNGDGALFFGCYEFDQDSDGDGKTIFQTVREELVGSYGEPITSAGQTAQWEKGVDAVLAGEVVNYVDAWPPMEDEGGGQVLVSLCFTQPGTVTLGILNTALEEPEQSAPSAEYDFTGETLDEYTKDLTGFGGLPWGYVLPQETVDALATGQNETIALTTVERFAGLTFHMERIFSYTSGIPGLEEDQRALVMGQYVMQGFLTPDDVEEGTAMAVERFNQTAAYLTQLYGQPDSYTLGKDGGAPEALTAPLTAEQYGAQGAGDGWMSWDSLENGRVTLQLADSYGLSLTVTFTPNAEPLADAGRTAITLEGVDAPGLAADVAGFEYALWGDSLQSVLNGEDWEYTELQGESTTFGGMPAKAYYTFQDGRLAAGWYALNAGKGNEAALTRAVVDYLAGLYGEPEFSQTPGEPQMIAWSNAEGRPKAGTAGPVVYTFDNGDVHVVFTAASAYRS